MSVCACFSRYIDMQSLFREPMSRHPRSLALSFSYALHVRDCAGAQTLRLV